MRKKESLLPSLVQWNEPATRRFEDAFSSAIEEFSESGENSMDGLDTEEVLQMFIGPRIQAAEFIIIKDLKAKYKEN